MTLTTSRLAAALLGGALLLAGCAGGDPAEPSGGAGETAAAAPADRTAEQILADARAAVARATSVHAVGDFRDGGETTTLDMRCDTKGQATGSFEVEGTKTRFRSTGGKVYTDASLFDDGSGTLKGKWIEANAKDETLKEVDTFTPQELVQESLRPEGTLTKVEGKPVDGVQTVGVKVVEKDGEGGTIYIATEGPAYPLLLESLKGKGELRYTEWDEPVTVEVPPEADVVSAKELLGG